MKLVRERTAKDGLLNAYAQRYGSAIRQRNSIIALRAAKIDAELAYRARGAFLQSMNHELRTPLNAITGFAGLLKQADDSSLDPEQRTQYLDYILQSADLLLAHINTILEIADAESGGTKLSRRAFQIQDLIEQVVEKIGGTDGRTITFETDFNEALPLVDADPDKIAVAIEHVIAFLDDPDRDAPTAVTIAARRGVAGQSASQVYVSMECESDASRGIIDEALRVFEQVHESLYRRFDQRKLGLPIAKSYIELNGGRFNAKAGDGHLRVRFALPVAGRDHQTTFERIAS